MNPNDKKQNKKITTYKTGTERKKKKKVGRINHSERSRDKCTRKYKIK